MLCLAVKALGAVFGEHLVLCLVSTWCFSFVLMAARLNLIGAA